MNTLLVDAYIALQEAREKHPNDPNEDLILDTMDMLSNKMGPEEIRILNEKFKPPSM